MSSVQNLVAIGVLALLGIVAAGIAHWSMSSDIGVAADSIYLSAPMVKVRDDLNNNHALIFYFDRLTWRWYLPTQSELEGTYNLPVVTRLLRSLCHFAREQKTRPQ